MTQKELRNEIIRNIEFWMCREALGKKGLEYKANIVIRGVKEGQLIILIDMTEDKTYIAFRQQSGRMHDIKICDGGIRDVEARKEEGLDYVVRYLAEKYRKYNVR